jgi:hypothetical protein
VRVLVDVWVLREEEEFAFGLLTESLFPLVAASLLFEEALEEPDGVLRVGDGPWYKSWCTFSRGP